MSDTPHSPEPLPWPERAAPVAGRIVHVAARILVGLFFLWQIFFMVVYNSVNTVKDSVNYLREQREQDQKEKDGKIWKLITRFDPLQEYVEEWLDAPDDARRKKTPFGECIETMTNLTRPYAKLTGQEQGWGLFAPDVVSWGSFPAVEFRWDTDAMDGELLKEYQSFEQKDRKLREGAKRFGLSIPSYDEPAHDPIIRYSDNEPANWRRFIRLGQFRMRRVESNFEVRLRRTAEQTEKEAELDWDSRIDNKVRGEKTAMLLYMKWRLREFEKEHPELLRPTQVILRCRNWSAPPPPGDIRAAPPGTPFDWTFHSDVPLTRWLPWKADNPMEIYRPSQKRYGGF